jgi:hypothetical protein
MLVVCNSRTDSTESTVAQLLAHESGSDVARMKYQACRTVMDTLLCNWLLEFINQT